MAFDPCDLESCLPITANGQTTYRLQVLRFLKAIVANNGATPVASAVQSEAIVGVTPVSGIILAANPLRKGAWVKNISDVDVYVSFSPTATLVKPTRLAPGSPPLFAGVGGTVTYTGVISAIHGSTGTKNVEVVEW